jgi:hypothetical protein
MRYALLLLLAAPSADRVGFPEGYREKFRLLRTTENPDKQESKAIYGNEAAASAFTAAPRSFPYGAILVMESRKQGGVTGLHVMRKERGFGQAYGPVRTGEWEYSEYKPDGSYLTPPQKSDACATCHLKAGDPKDFVYGVPR